MEFVEARLECRQDQLEAVEDGLLECGACAVTLEDADLDSPDEQAIFEPGVGETPLWKQLVVSALFEAPAAPLEIMASLAEQVPGLDITRLRFRELPDQDWTRAWMDRFQPMGFGRRLWIYPSTTEPPVDEDIVVVRLDPGMAFGTGTHPTTALCLEWLDGIDVSGRDVLDFGCGSGVLAIAALKLGAAEATGIDNDPQAIDSSAENARRNGEQEKLRLYLSGDSTINELQPFPVVLANILANALDELAPALAKLTAPDGRIVLSGILDGQQEPLLQRYGEWFDQLEVKERDGWVRIDGRRRNG